MKNLIVKLILCFNALFYAAVFGNETISDFERHRLQPTIVHFFPSEPLDSFAWHRLSGGYSDAANYKIDCSTCKHPYVLRLHQPSQRLREVKREFWAFEQASKLGVAPHVYGVWLQNKALLTDYQETHTITLKQAQQPETILAVATAFRQVHKIPKNPIQYHSVADEYRKRARQAPASPFIDEALEVINASEKQLLESPINAVTLHGDPNPRNVFVDPSGVKFIDWSETTWDEAFYDLSYFVLFLDYDRQQVQNFLRSYLGHDPSAEEWKRYILTEKINLAGFSIILNSVAPYLANAPLSEDSPIYEWSHYAGKFAAGEELSPQEIYDWSKAGLRDVAGYPVDEIPRS